MTSSSPSRPEPVGEGTSTTRPPIEVSGLLGQPERFYLRLAPSALAREVSRHEYLHVERACGFVPAFQGEPAAAHFNANGIEGWCDGLKPDEARA